MHVQPKIFSAREPAVAGALEMRPQLPGVCTIKLQPLSVLDKNCQRFNQIGLAGTSSGTDSRGMIPGSEISTKCATHLALARFEIFFGSYVSQPGTRKKHCFRTHDLQPILKLGLCQIVTFWKHVWDNVSVSCLPMLTTRHLILQELSSSPVRRMYAAQALMDRSALVPLTKF
jgi:hypothetical protein